VRLGNEGIWLKSVAVVVMKHNKRRSRKREKTRTAFKAVFCDVSRYCMEGILPERS
jgi:hypothetical protein